MTTRTLIRLTSVALLLVLAADCGSGKGGGSGPNGKPVASVGGPYTTTTGTVTFNGSASSDPDGDALTYAWDFGDGAHGTGAQPSHTYAATGTYTVRLTVTDARSASSDPASGSAQVNNVPPAVNAGTDKTVLAGAAAELSIGFTDGADGPWTYLVQWGDGQSNNGSRNAAGTVTATHAYGSEATYKVQVNVTDRFGAVGRDSVSLTVTAPVLIAAGDIGDCGPTRWYDDSTGALVSRLGGIVAPLGDNAYERGTPDQFATCYDAAWGRVKDRTRPVAGNHDYYNPRADSVKNADGYYGYFGTSAGDPTKGYYSYTLGSWLVIVLNTGTERGGDIAAGSPQEQWLRAQLSSSTQQCTVVMFHHPRFTSTLDRPWLRPEVKALWDASYQYGVDLILNGHDHGYQRFAPQTPDGVADAAFGIRQITVGTGGGEGLYQYGPTVANLQVRDNTSYGVLKLTLRAGGYDWQFMPITGQSFTDAGSGTCHGRP
jgi:chitodextrinase